MGLQRGQRVTRAAVRPQRVDGPVGADVLAAPQDEQRQQPALQVTVGGDVAPVGGPQAHRAEHVDEQPLPSLHPASR